MSYSCAAEGPVVVGAWTVKPAWLSGGIDGMSGRELTECVLLSIYMLFVICGQGCCTAGHVVCVGAVGRGLL